MSLENNHKYLIVPVCSDLNRGDQALVLETKNVAEEAGFIGEFHLISTKGEVVGQLEREGIKTTPSILEHPSRFGKKKNTKYSISLLFKWGIVAVVDFLSSFVLLNKYTRKVFKVFLSAEKKETLEIYKNSDAVFVKGGGFIHSYGEPSALYYMYFVLYHIMLAQSFEKKVYIMPNSFGPFKGIGVKRFANRVLNRCTLITSRESISTDALQTNLDIKADTYPDLAFFLQKRETEKTNSILKNISRKKVAITMRPYRFPGSNNSLQSYKLYKAALSEFVLWLYNSGYMPVIVEHTLSVTEHENDLSCIQDVISNIPHDSYVLISDKTFDCRDLKNIYSKCDYIVGTRFHSVIFSMAESVPGIAITYGGNKGNGIMKDMGLNQYSIPIDNISFEKLKSSFELLVKNDTEIKLKIKEYIKKASKQKEQLINRMKEN